jgi:hypothetical protein
VKTTLDLPEDLIQEVKLRALLQRRTVKDLVAECLRLGLAMPSPRRAEHPPASSRVVTGEDGLPLFRCAPDAPATRMSVGKLLALEQESQTQEDLERAGLPL